MATGVCYTQSGTEKRYEPKEWWQPSDSARVAIYKSGSTPASDPIPTAPYTLRFGDLHNDGLAYGDKNPDGSYQCVYIFCRSIGDDVKIYDSFPTPPPASQYYTYSYIGVRTEYGGNVKWHVGFNVKKYNYSIALYILPVSEDISKLNSGFNCSIYYAKFSDGDNTEYYPLNDFEDRGIIGIECSTTNEELIHKSNYFTDPDFINDIFDVKLSSVEWDDNVPNEYRNLICNNWGLNNSNNTFEIFLSWE